MNAFKETPYWWEEAEPQAADNGSPPPKKQILSWLAEASQVWALLFH